jgi:uncharacterized damage-inducible protein DinB
MARYNAWQNGSMLEAADALSAEEREAERGAFFGSIRATFSHLLWADRIWMSRLSNWERPEGGIAESAAHETDWARLATARREADAAIVAWADGLDRLEGPLAWWSGAAGREVTRPRALCMLHMFNHQTHHRGQIHAMLTATGARPGATDLFVMP